MSGSGEPEPFAAGVDGCRAGWIAVIRRRPEEAPEARVFPRFDFLLDALGPGVVVAVDMPIGLPERIEGPGRAAEKAVRPLLSARQSSVFSIPARAAVEAGAGPFRSELHRREMHVAACRLAERLSHPPRGVSIQGFGLFPRIMEIDRLLGADPSLAERVIESHPEFAFHQLNDGAAMTLPKKIKGQVNPAGMEERRRLLVARGLPRAFLYSAPPAGAAADDVLDASAMLLVAERHRRGEARPHPEPLEHDARGLPIAIWF
ncbi:MULTISPECIES: DUF429 domain-containing protein [unclassified Aureimonas]|uniref:DUF429 domain-containing protein n=1 Tax=unclassified Aureimonas TaxID=2615206 RepID=UPI0006FD873D|nr:MULTISPECIES: DUF429 domain-containing protein [unclassified Aureimonas]KQT52612.1 hypothetical protein ASG62_15540 [Aureimonas sp. Leaf427]KQT77489.1 hypothetical protein ASG54_10870 [Aureimonas sp. Leaf460]